MPWQTTVIAIFAALLILEGLLIVILPKQTLKIIKKMLKQQKTLRTIGIIEAIIGVLLMLAVLYYY